MIPADDKAKRRYQGEEGRRYHQRKREIPEAAFPWVARLRALKIAPHVKAGDRVLEYGVGLGWNLAALECARKIGVDVGEFLEPMVRQRGIEFLSDASRLGDESIDVVLCHHTLEHAWHPPELLAIMRRLLRASGRLLLFVPYEQERRFRRFQRDEPNHHLYSWNVQTLGNLVEEAGFRVETAGVAPFGQERFAAALATRLRLGERSFRVLQWAANRLKGELEVRLAASKSSR